MHLNATIYNGESRRAETLGVLESNARLLIHRVCGSSVPIVEQGVSASIRSSSAGKWAICGHWAEVRRDSWSTGRGYGLIFDLNL